MKLSFTELCDSKSGLHAFDIVIIHQSLCPLFFIKFLFFHQMKGLQKLQKMFISSQKLFTFLRYSNFCNFFTSFPHFPEPKGQMEVE